MFIIAQIKRLHRLYRLHKLAATCTMCGGDKEVYSPWQDPYGNTHQYKPCPACDATGEEKEKAPELAKEMAPEKPAKKSKGNLPRDSKGKLSAYAWPGGYPYFYIINGKDVYCHECAVAEDTYNQLVTDEDAPGNEVTAADINWEDDSLYCENCGDRIESAYAEPEDNTP